MWLWKIRLRFVPDAQTYSCMYPLIRFSFFAFSCLVRFQSFLHSVNVCCVIIHRLRMTACLWKTEKMPFSHEQLWLAVVFSVTVTAAAGRPDVRYRPAASLTPASVLVWFFFCFFFPVFPSLADVTLFFLPVVVSLPHSLFSCINCLQSFCHPSVLWSLSHPS